MALLSRAFVVAVFGLFIRVGVAAEVGMPADAWLTNDVVHPHGLHADPAEGRFDSLEARLVDRFMRISIQPVPAGEPPWEAVRIHWSTDAPGRWFARDWRTEAMLPSQDGGRWQVRLPLASARVPVVYFAEAIGGGRTNVSNMRAFHPDRAGALDPTYPFTGHIEGFEDGWTGWEASAPSSNPPRLAISTNASSGRQALRIEVPAGRGSATLGTVRLRGWMLVEHSPRAVAFMVRSEGGTGRVRLTLLSRSRTSRIETHPAGTEIEIGPEWRRIEIPLTDFRGVRWGEVDWLSLQFLAEPGRAFLVDDFELVLG